MHSIYTPILVLEYLPDPILSSLFNKEAINFNLQKKDKNLKRLHFVFESS